MLAFWKHSQNNLLKIHTRLFARNIASQGMYGDRSFIYPTPAEEFDAKRHKMKAKYENIHEIQWHDRVRGRNIFRYETQFPEYKQEYRGTDYDRESKIFKENARKIQKEFGRRSTQNVLLGNLKEGLRWAKKQKSNQIKEPNYLEEYLKVSGIL